MKPSTPWPLLSMITLLTLIGGNGIARANMEIQFSGVLQIPPCSLNSGEIDVTFPDVNVQDFYNSTRTGITPFKIELAECSAVIGKNINVRFEGPEENNLPGYLAVEGENKGALAIGIVDSDLTSLLKLKAQSQNTPIENDSLTLTYGAFVKATPYALTNNKVKAAGYTATASFTLNYE